ncbi:MAG: GtrA family protein [Fibrobacter sp.]|nr:GtrA family protein [Fibrobacter sp.]
MKHFIKYNIIGVMNTLITLASVWVMHQLLDWNLELSNFLGFIFGAINSYLMNRIWNFKSTNRKRSEIVRFVIVFIAAYALNLVTLEATVYALNTAWCKPFTDFISQYMKPGFFANIVANVVYVIASFTLYKKWVFKK